MKDNYTKIDHFINNYYEKKDNTVFYSIYKKNRAELDREVFEVKKYFKKQYSEEFVKTALGRKWRSNIANLMAFIDLYQYMTERNDYVQCIPISSKSDVLLDMFSSNHQNVSNILAIAQKVELLYCVRHDYQFNSYNSAMDKCKCYILNKDVQDIIKEISIENNITYNKYTKINTITAYKNSSNISSSKLFEKVRINSGLGNMRITDDIGHKTKEDFIATIEKILDYKYPQIRVMQEEANWINQQQFYQEHPELQVRCTPKVKFTKSGAISKISLRASNRIVSLKANNVTDHDIRTRVKYLTELFGTDYQTYDVKASIYQITHALNTNNWLDNKVDMYKAIYGKEFDSKEIRNKIKALCMVLYFDKSFDKATKHIADKMGIDKNTITESLFTIYNNLITAVGGTTYDSEIFLHESVIYNHVTYELIKKGWKVVQIYDGWYAQHFNKELNLKDEIDSLLTSSVTSYINTYFNNKNT